MNTLHASVSASTKICQPNSSGFGWHVATSSLRPNLEQNNKVGTGKTNKVTSSSISGCLCPILHHGHRLSFNRHPDMGPAGLQYRTFSVIDTPPASYWRMVLLSQWRVPRDTFLVANCRIATPSVGFRVSGKLSGSARDSQKTVAPGKKRNKHQKGIIHTENNESPLAKPGTLLSPKKPRKPTPSM